MVRLVSLGVLLVLILFLGVTFYQVVAPFLLPLFLAGVVTVLCQPLHQRFVQRLVDKPRLAAGMTTATVLVIILVPLLVGVLVATLQLYSISQESIGTPEWNEQLDRINSLAAEWGLASSVPDPAVEGSEPSSEPGGLKSSLSEALRGLADRSAGASGATLGRWVGSIMGMVIGGAMFGIALYYFLADGPALLAAAMRMFPFNPEYQKQLLGEFESVVRSVVSATLLASVAQGLLTAVALWVVGTSIDSDLLRHFFLFFILSTLTSLIPVTGAWLVWMPVAIWLGFNDHLAGAVMLSLFGVVVIGTLDNLIRVHVLHNDTRLHPLLAFVSVLGGVHEMGLWGVFIGPIVACCLHALIGMFNTELGEISMRKFFSGVSDDETPEGEQESIDPAGEQNVTESGGEGETVEMAETAETDDVAGDGASPDESSSRDR
jgi:predicted PurR-regulated permease PerM